MTSVTTVMLDGRPWSFLAVPTRWCWRGSGYLPIAGPFPGHVGAVNSVAAAVLDGQPVAVSGGDDGTVRVWDLATGTPVVDPFPGHVGAVNSVAAAVLDGQPVAVSGGDDGTVRVWDLATGAPVAAPLTGHTGAVASVTTAMLDGRPVLISRGDDGRVRVSDLVSGASIGSRHSGHTSGVTAGWLGRSAVGRWPSWVVMTGRCGSGTWLLAHRSLPRLQATPAR